MAGKVIDGKTSAAKLREKIAAYAADLKAKHGLQPGLATVLVGQDPASEVYVRNKRKTAEAIGFKSVHVELPANVSQAELLDRVRALSADPSVHGILVQLPLPKHLDENIVLDALDPAKDVDALTPVNAGLLLSGLVMWRAYFSLYFPIGLIRLASLLHAVCAFVLICAILVHVYAAIWVKGSLHAMLRGTVTPGWAWKHHRAWFRQITHAAHPRTGPD